MRICPYIYMYYGFGSGSAALLYELFADLAKKVSGPNYVPLT